MAVVSSPLPLPSARCSSRAPARSGRRTAVAPPQNVRMDAEVLRRVPGGDPRVREAPPEAHGEDPHRAADLVRASRSRIASSQLTSPSRTRGARRSRETSSSTRWRSRSGTCWRRSSRSPTAPRCSTRSTPATPGRKACPSSGTPERAEEERSRSRVNAVLPGRRAAVVGAAVAAAEAPAAARGGALPLRRPPPDPPRHRGQRDPRLHPRRGPRPVHPAVTAMKTTSRCAPSSRRRARRSRRRSPPRRAPRS